MLSENEDVFFQQNKAVFQDTLRLISALHQEPSTKHRGLLPGFAATLKFESTSIDVKNRHCLEEVAFLRGQDPGASIGLVSACVHEGGGQAQSYPGRATSCTC